MALHKRGTCLAIYAASGGFAGFGRSRGYGAMSLDEMAQQVLDAAPQNAIWLGWSLGGLVASQIALAP
jgi:pimeloyl-ACP methyl ester carboxylesterase